MTKQLYTQIYVACFILSLTHFFINVEQYSDQLFVLLTVAVVTLGLPHGALDFRVAKSLNLINTVFSALTFIVAYILLSALAIAFWMWQPGTALIIFLIISIHHFSADWRGALPFAPRIYLAAAVICGPSILNSVILSGIFTNLLVSADLIAYVIFSMQVVFVLSTLMFMTFMIFKVRKESPNGWLIAEWCVLLIGSVVLPPLLHFVLYFCVLHSPKHLHDVSDLLKVSMKRALLIGLPFVLLTLVLAIGTFAWLGSGTMNVDLLRWIFIGLFGLTMSHMGLIHFWHRSKV